MTELSLLVDSASVSSPGGERLQVELSAALDRTCPAGARAVVLRRPDQSEIGGFTTIRDEVVDVSVSSWPQKWRWHRTGFPAAARRLRPTAAFAANGIVSRRLLRLCGVISTTNNMLPFSPEQLKGYPALSATGLRLRLSRALTVRGLKAADVVILHSRHALDTLSAFAGDIAPKTTVVLTGIPRDARLDETAPRPAHPYGERPYLLYFSAVRRFKNHLALIEAYRRLAERLGDLPDLVLAGVSRDADYLAAIRDSIRRTALNGRIKYVGEVPREDVRSWLHHATVNVFPSLCETNSVIQAEILGVGGVMATSDVPPMPEVAGGAAELFDPHDPDDIARVLERLWREPERRRRLSERALERAGELSWDRCGEAIWQAARTAGERFRERGGSA